MCNCNNKRAALQGQEKPPHRGMVKVILSNEIGHVVHGNVTGRVYVFRTKHDFNWVDKRDLPDIGTNQGLRIEY